MTNVAQRDWIRTRFLVWVTLCLFSATGTVSSQEWKTGQGFRQIKLAPQTTGRSGFTQLSNHVLGLMFTNRLSVAKMLDNNNLLNGAGVASGDFDGDGLPDLFFSSLEGRSELYRNLGGWRFTNVTVAAGVTTTNLAATGAMFVDWNGDAKLDLIVMSCGGSNACFLNLGGGRFTNVAPQVGLSWRLGSTGMAAGDLNGDGWLDLYVANYGENTIRSGISLATRTVNGKEVVTGRWANRVKIIAGKLIEFGEPDSVALNTGRGEFSIESWKAGLFLGTDGKPLSVVPWDMGLSVAIRDLNGDGRPDIYVCNDFQTPDRIWLNDGQGHFAPMSEKALRALSHFSMSIDVADVNRDGFMDILVADMKRRSHASEMQQSEPATETTIPGEWETRPQIRQNTLFLNRGDGTYAEIAEFAGLAATDWTWCVAFLDIDLDGYEDVLVANGHGFDTENKDVSNQLKAKGTQTSSLSRTNLLAYPPLLTPNLAFKNGGNLKFTERGKEWGFNSTQVSHGMSFADFDGDGDLDVVVSCLNAPPLIYRNETDAPRIAVRLKGMAPNVAGIGARLTFTIGSRAQTQEMAVGGRYLSSDAAERVFSAAPIWSHAGDSLGRLEVRWPSGKVSLIDKIEPNTRYEVDEAGSVANPVSIKSPPSSLFTDVSTSVNLTVEDAVFDDFSRQPLLPRKLSTRGPPLLWLGKPDGKGGELWVGGGQVGKIRRLTTDGVAWHAHEIVSVETETTAFATVVWEGKPHVLVGASGYRLPDPTGVNLTLFQRDGGLPGPVLAISATNLSCLVSGDFGVFVGEGSVPGAYPKSLGSRLIFRPSDSKPSALAIGEVVNGGVAADIDGDGKQDLVLATEWGPVRVYLNRQGQLQEATDSYGLSEFKGWWNTVISGDFDGDGRTDLMASNWGSNTRWQSRRTQTLRLYAGDFDSDGTTECLEAFFDPETQQFVPEHGLGFLSQFWPQIAQRFPTFRSLATVGIDQVLGSDLNKALRTEANWLETTLFLNRGDRFEARMLPMEAQFAPVFGMAAADFDGDGNLDVALAQNFSGVRGMEPKMQGGRGLVLLGDGRGGFVAQTSEQSGLRVDGDGRACIAADFDGDGRPDLAMSQWNGEVKIFKNTGGRSAKK